MEKVTVPQISIATSSFVRVMSIMGKEYHMSPPTIRQAVEILHVLNHLKDEEDRDLLVYLISKLEFDPVLKKRVIRKALKRNPKGTAKAISRAITQGYDPQKLVDRIKSSDDRPAESGNSDQPIEWEFLISEYCTVYGSDPWTVYNQVPFVFLMEFLPMSRRQDARNKLRLSTVVGVGFGGDKDKKITETWTRQAGGPSQNERKAEKYKTTTNQADLEKEREKIKDTLMRGGR